jgi:hypothetical protein
LLLFLRQLLCPALPWPVLAARLRARTVWAVFAKDAALVLAVSVLLFVALLGGRRRLAGMPRLLQQRPLVEQLTRALQRALLSTARL